MKVFISHSSAQKSFAIEVIKEIGMDYTYLDKYTFEAGKNLYEEIKEQIFASNLFVYLISKEALNSDWVKQELGIVRDLIDEDKIIFCPFIIDEDVKPEDKNIRPWVKKYLLKCMSSPVLIGRNIKAKIRERLWVNYPNLEKEYNLFIGRDKDISEITRKFYAPSESSKKALVVSGIQHIGKKRLLQEVIINKIIDKSHPSYCPLKIPLKETDYLDDFALLLNDCIQKYEREELLKLLKNKITAVNTVVILVNLLVENQEKILIQDDMCIVKGNGEITEWFQDILLNKNLLPQINFFIAARCQIRSSYLAKFPFIIYHQANQLEKPDVITLFRAYSELKKLQIDADEINNFCKDMPGYPKLVRQIVNDLNVNDLQTAKNNYQQFKQVYYDDYTKIINMLHEKDRALQVMLVISKFEFISFDFLIKICGHNISSIIEELQYYSLYEAFGSYNQYLRLVPSLTDYISRSKIPLQESYKRIIRRLVKTDLTDIEPYVSDLSEFLFNVKETIKFKKGKLSEDFLLPSFFLKVIVNEYNNKKDSNVITLAKKILYDTNRYYDSIIRNIEFWLCCSLCRKQDDSFFAEVEYFHHENHSYNFLKGFYYRHARNYKKALEFYERAIKNYSLDRDFTTKTEHEIVIVKMKLEDYKGALQLAKSNYEKRTTNKYDVDAYLDCLIKTKSKNVTLMKSLLTKLETLFNNADEERVIKRKNELNNLITGVENLNE